MALRKKREQCVPHRDPVEGPDYIEADVQALRAVWNGHATADQQKRAIEWLIAAYGTYDLSFRRGGAEADRDSTFAEGRRHAGMILVHMLKYAESKTSADKIAVRLLGEQDGRERTE